MKVKVVAPSLAMSFVLFLATCNLKREKNVGSENSRTVKTAVRIFDEIGLLSHDEKKEILSHINQLEETIGSQIGIVIIDTLRLEALETFSLRTARELRLGRPGLEDGILIVIVYKSYSIRIEVADGLEKIVGDEVAARIIRENMIPEFEQDKYYEGVLAGVKKLKMLIERDRHLVGQKVPNNQ